MQPTCKAHFVANNRGFQGLLGFVQVKKLVVTDIVCTYM